MEGSMPNEKFPYKVEVGTIFEVPQNAFLQHALSRPKPEDNIKALPYIIRTITNKEKEDEHFFVATMQHSFCTNSDPDHVHICGIVNFAGENPRGKKFKIVEIWKDPQTNKRSVTLESVN